jgi:hypothetical protein
MDPSEQINKQIWRMFPEFAGVQPSVKVLSNSRGEVFSYHTRVALPNGTALDRWVRVTRKPNGEIQKITTSR